VTGPAAPLGHEESAEALAAYALGALPEEEAHRLEAHLVGCDGCRGLLAELRVAVDALPAAAPPVSPPPELKERIMGVVRSEAQLLDAAGKRADEPEPERRRRARRFPFALPRPAVAAVAVVGLAGAGALGFALGSGDGDGPGARTLEARMAGGAPDTHMAVRVSDGRATVSLRDMPSPPPRRVWQLWVRSGDRPPVPAGTFVLRSGQIEVPRRVRRGDQLLVTDEPPGGSPVPTRAPVAVTQRA
jgi:anti-sigma-K factor RskA